MQMNLRLIYANIIQYIYCFIDCSSQSLSYLIGDS